MDIIIEDTIQVVTISIDYNPPSGGGSTNLGYTASPTNGIVTSDTGTDAIIPLSTDIKAGLLSPAEKTKLEGIEEGATLNSDDVTLLDRTNHTGTQLSSTISDFNTAVSALIITPDTSFLNVAYAATISKVFDQLRPNIEIDLTGDLDLTITGTANGDSGLVNLYFSATEVATLNGITDLVVTGAGEMIPVYFIHDTDGLKWYQDEVGSDVDTSLFALQDGTILYHTLPRFTPTGTISTLGTNVTISSTQFTSTMVGAKLKINGEERIITTYIGNNNVTVDSAYNVDYVNELSTNWNLYNIAVQVTSVGGISVVSSTNGTVITAISNGNAVISSNVTGQGNIFLLSTNGLALTSTGNLRHSSTTSTAGTADIGLRRNAAGVYEVYNGVNADGLETNRRDLLVRNLISKSNVYADDAAADADATLPSGAFYKITGSRAIYQKP